MSATSFACWTALPTAPSVPDPTFYPCGGDGNVDIGDILAGLDAFSGLFLCPPPCPP